MTLKNAKMIFLGLIAFETVLVVIFLIDCFMIHPIYKVHRIFNLDGEATLPTWFSSIQLFVIGFVLSMKSLMTHSKNSRSSFFPLLVGLGFIFLSADEAVMIHENITELLNHIEWLPRFQGNHGIWIPLYLTVGLTVLCLNLKKIIRLFRHFFLEASIMSVGIGIWLSGVVGVEIISYYIQPKSVNPMLYHLEVAIEEFLEMLGVTILLYGVTLYTILDTDGLEKWNRVKNG